MFFCIYWDDLQKNKGLCSLFFWYGNNILVDFQVLNQFCFPKINSTLHWCIMVFMCYWIWFGSILLRIKKINCTYFLERGEGRRRGRETSMWKRNIHWLPLRWPGSDNSDMWSDWNPESVSDLSLCRRIPNLMSHRSGCEFLCVCSELIMAYCFLSGDVFIWYHWYH